MMKYSDGLLFGAGLLVGAVVGGVAAALLTPRSGQDVRDQVAERGLELRHRTEEVVQRAQQVASEAVTKVRSSARELLGQQPGTAGAVEAGEPS